MQSLSASVLLLPPRSVVHVQRYYCSPSCSPSQALPPSAERQTIVTPPKTPAAAEVSYYLLVGSFVSDDLCMPFYPDASILTTLADAVS